MNETPLKSIETDTAEVPEHASPPEQPRGGLMAAQMTAYIGAVPPPDMVRAYEEILPGSANRFLQVAEREQQRRIDNDKAEASLAMAQEENSKSNYRWGLVCSCGLMALYLIIMLICVFADAPAQFLTAMLGIPAISALASIVAFFMNRTKD